MNKFRFPVCGAWLVSPRIETLAWQESIGISQTISVYVRMLEEPNLNILLTKVNGQLTSHEELRGYVLLLGGGQFDEKLKSKIRDWAKEQAFTKLDVAIAIGDAKFGIAKEAGVVVVYSEKLHVKYQRTIESGKLDESAVKELAEKLAEVRVQKP